MRLQHGSRVQGCYSHTFTDVPTRKSAPHPCIERLAAACWELSAPFPFNAIRAMRSQVSRPLWTCRICNAGCWASYDDGSGFKMVHPPAKKRLSRLEDSTPRRQVGFEIHLETNSAQGRDRFAESGEATQNRGEPIAQVLLRGSSENLATC